MGCAESKQTATEASNSLVLSKPNLLLLCLVQFCAPHTCFCISNLSCGLYIWWYLWLFVRCVLPTHASHYPMISEHLINTAAGHSIMHYHQDKPYLQKSSQSRVSHFLQNTVQTNWAWPQTETGPGIHHRVLWHLPPARWVASLFTLMLSFVTQETILLWSG